MVTSRWSECDLIPYVASAFPARSALVLAPHPDDEVFGCGAGLASLRAAGMPVDVLLLTDGAGEEPGPEERRRIAGIRLAESRTALEHLGGGTVSTAGFPDRSLASRRGALASVMAEALRTRGPGLVFVPSPLEIHPDHRAAAEALLDAAGELGEATVAFFELSQPFRPNFLLDATPHAAAKERAMAAFVSQNGARDYPSYVRGLNTYRRMTLPDAVTLAEGYFVLPAAELRKLSREALCRAMSPWAGEGGGGLRELLGRMFRQPVGAGRRRRIR